MIEYFQVHHKILKRYSCYIEILSNKDYINYREAFREYCKKKEYSKLTAEYYPSHASYFMKYLELQGINSIKSINIEIIESYIKTLSRYTRKTIEYKICGIKSFLRFLNDCEILKNNLFNRILLYHTKDQARIPSVWTEDELKKLFGAINKSNPIGKRDYAILLLACFLGMRVSDIKQLTFSCFDWENKKITFTQSKTNVEIVLPIPNIVGWAIIDYLKNGRPKSDSDIIFLRHVAPFDPFSDKCSLRRMIEKYMLKAHIPILNKHRGMHSLRHTAASRLLEAGTTLDTISNILGHEDPESTSVYLKVDLEQLRKCCIDIPGDEDE